MENTIGAKSLTDLINKPNELSAILENPAEAGIKFYQSLASKDKQYVIFAAAIGLIAYGLYLNRTSLSSAGNGSSGGKGQNRPAAPRELNVKKNH